MTDGVIGQDDSGEDKAENDQRTAQYDCADFLPPGQQITGQRLIFRAGAVITLSTSRRAFNPQKANHEDQHDQ